MSEVWARSEQHHTLTLTISLICMALAEAIAIFGLVIVLTKADVVKQGDEEGEAQQEEVQTQ